MLAVDLPSFTNTVEDGYNLADGEGRYYDWLYIRLHNHPDTWIFGCKMFDEKVFYFLFVLLKTLFVFYPF